MKPEQTIRKISLELAGMDYNDLTVCEQNICHFLLTEGYIWLDKNENESIIRLNSSKWANLVSATGKSVTQE